MFGYRKSILPRFGLAGGAVAAAMGIGFFMQNGDSAHLAAMYAQPSTAEPAISTPADVKRATPQMAASSGVETAADLQGVLEGQVAKFEPASVMSNIAQSISGIQMTSSDAGVSMSDVEGTELTPSMNRRARQVTSGTGCGPTMTAVSGPSALIDVAIDAPCHANARVTLHHEGMMFTARTNALGQADVIVPALKIDSVVVAAFLDGAGAVVETATPSLKSYDRVVLQWQGNSGLQIHAFEYGSTYNQNGHIWSGRPMEQARAEAGQGGFMMPLGDISVENPLLAEVYTFPSGAAKKSGNVEMTVEAEVTRENCQREVAAQTLQFAPSAGLKIQDLEFTLPDCQAIGEFLVLNNLLKPVQLAQR